ncbi:MAG: hypothetical protein J6T10_32405 [Methanobrevibacter sp.]|nr:hypothetical protein [Methanobrevibacter sp.]
MSTRGLWGFRKNNVDKLTYNHFDSYPSGLGREIIEFIQNNCLELENICKRIILVDEESTPTEKQIEELKDFADLTVSTRSENDWYCLLRKAQEDKNVYAQGLKYMIDNKNFILDSVFCEYAYIINLDTKKLEIYVGFQNIPDETNRYGCQPNSEGYYPCRLVYAIDLIDVIRCKDNNKLIKDIEKIVE